MSNYDDPEPEPLTHVAIILDNRVWSLPKPYRHHHIFQIVRHLGEGPFGDGTQGFLDARGRFLTRKQAEVNARVNGQIKNGKLIGSILTSEDLW